METSSYFLFLTVFCGTINECKYVSGLETSYQRDANRKARKKFSIGVKIINATKARIEEYPWSAFLMLYTPSGPRGVCTGAIIDTNWILTAGHCAIESR